MGNIKYDFTGKVVAITGASGGIGKSFATCFAAAGAKVVIGDLKEKEGADVIKEIEAAGGQAIFVQTNVADKASAENFIQRAIDNYGKLDILINGAGVSNDNKGNPFTNITDADYEKCMNVNIMGAVHTCRAVYDHMKSRGYGRIINVSSVVYRSTNPLNVPYVITKAANASLTLNLAKELGPHGVTVNNICPGVVYTPIYDHDFECSKDNRPDFHGKTALDLVDHVAAQLCGTKKRQEPEEIANAAMFLSADESLSLNGITIEISGGYKL